MATLPNNDHKPKLVLVSPTGGAIERVLTRGVQYQSVDEIDPNGTINQHHGDDFPDMEIIDIRGEHLSDGADSEFLGRHCRLVTVPGNLDIDMADRVLEPWPDDIIKACARCEALAWALWNLMQLRHTLPLDCQADTTIRVALDNIVEGRLKGEFDQLDAQIAAFRKTRTEPTEITEVWEAYDAAQV